MLKEMHSSNSEEAVRLMNIDQEADVSNSQIRLYWHLDCINCYRLIMLGLCSERKT